MFWLSLIFIVCIGHANALEFRYHNYSDMTQILQDLARRYPSKASLVEIGKSQRGKSLWAMALSASQPGEHRLLRPEVKYIGNMHGNEVVGLEVLLHLIEYLLTSNDTNVLQLMSQSRVWIMPSMNPDGLEISQYGDCDSIQGRYNQLGIDLNRNFPDYYGARLQSSTRAVETAAVMAWLGQVPFVLSANYHGGDFVINTPLDRYYVGAISTSADDDIFQMLGRRYIAHTAINSDSCMGSFSEKGYVTRGADWYEIVGGMQDYGYFNYGTLELTMEISCCKYPQAATLANYWNYNRNAMVDMLLQAQRGVKGRVFNIEGQPIASAEIMIDQRRPVVRTTSLGEFWRVLLPGTYTLRVLVHGNEVHREQITISDSLIPLELNLTVDPSLNNAVTSSLCTSRTPVSLFLLSLLICFRGLLI